MELVGIVPAAGRGERLGSGFPKELLPVVFERGEAGIRPVPAAAIALERIREAGASRALVVVSTAKLELVRILEDGERVGLPLAYVHREPRGLADAVQQASSWAPGANQCLVLPDTLYRPADALKRVCAELARADLVLGVFPTEHPETLGPVRLEQGRVLEVLEKPTHTDLRNTWGVAAWTPRFSEMLARSDVGHASIGELFHAAIGEMTVRAVSFEDGSYRDVGTPEGLADLVS